MISDKLKIIELIKDLIGAIDTYLINFPHKEIELKRSIKEITYNLLVITQEANVTSNLNKRLDLQEKAISMVKVLDYMISRCYEKEIINGKKYLKFGESLENILKYLVGWLNTTKKNLDVKI